MGKLMKKKKPNKQKIIERGRDGREDIVGQK